MLTYELELNQRVETTIIEINKNNKGVALKAAEVSSKVIVDDDSDLDDDDDDEDLSQKIEKIHEERMKEQQSKKL